MTVRARPVILGLYGMLGLLLTGVLSDTRPLHADLGGGSSCCDYPIVHGFPTTTAPATADPPTPVVNLRVRVPPSVGLGQELTYKLIVENSSTGAAHHVILRNPLPINARYVRAQPEPTARAPELVWELGTLSGGTRREITLVLAPTGKGDIQNCARVQFEHGQCVTTKVARPGISLRKSGPSQALLYDHLNYQLAVTNTGVTEITNVQLTDILSAGLEHEIGNRLRWDLGTLAPGQTRVLTYQAIAKQAGRLRTTAVVTADGDLRDEAESTVVVSEPRLGVKITGPAQRTVSTGTPYQITVTNSGAAPLADVRVDLTLPANVTLVSLTQGGGRADNRVSWIIGSLAPGASRNLDVVLRAKAAGEARLEATVSSARGLKASDTLTTTFVGIPAVTLDVVVSDNPVEVGGLTAYRITMRNPGSQPVTNLRIVATLPAHLELVQAPGNPKRDGAKVVFDPFTLPAGGESPLEIRTKALKPGIVVFRVDLTADQLTGGAVTQEVPTTIYKDLP